MRPICCDCQREWERDYRERNQELLRERRIARRAVEAAYRREYNTKNRGRLLATEAIRRATRKGIPCDLQDHLPEIERRVQLGTCEMTGIAFNFHSSGPTWNSPSLHRIVPAEGYIYRNIQVVCFGMNAALGNWGESALATMLDAWSQRRK